MRAFSAALNAAWTLAPGPGVFFAIEPDYFRSLPKSHAYRLAAPKKRARARGMPYEVYKVLHLVGVFAILLSLGGISIHMASGGSRSSIARRLVGMTHGVALLVTLVAGFGLLARLGLAHPMPGWAIGKIVIWLLLGASPTLIYRKPQLAKAFFALVLVLGATAAWLAVYKPF